MIQIPTVDNGWLITNFPKDVLFCKFTKNYKTGELSRRKNQFSEPMLNFGLLQRQKKEVFKSCWASAFPGLTMTVDFQRPRRCD